MRILSFENISNWGNLGWRLFLRLDVSLDHGVLDVFDCCFGRLPVSMGTSFPSLARSLATLKKHKRCDEMVHRFASHRPDRQFFSFAPPLEVLELDQSDFTAALTSIHIHIIEGWKMSGKQVNTFQWAIDQTFELMRACLSRATATEALLKTIEERAILGMAESCRLYDPVRTQKVMSEPDYESFMDFADAELNDVLQDDWPSCISHTHKERLCQGMQPEVRTAVDVLQSVQAGASLQRKLQSFCQRVAEQASFELAPRTLGVRQVSPDGNVRAAHQSTSLTISQSASPRKVTVTVSVGSAPRKGIMRILEKLFFECEAHKSLDVRYLWDIARNELRASSIRGLQAILTVVLKMHKDKVIRIVRAKNRFRNPTAGGWSDLVLNCVFLDDPNLHVFELQLVHEKLSLMRAHIGGHADYKITRAAVEIKFMMESRFLEPGRQLSQMCSQASRVGQCRSSLVSFESSANTTANEATHPRTPSNEACGDIAI